MKVYLSGGPQSGEIEVEDHEVVLISPDWRRMAFHHESGVYRRTGRTLGGLRIFTWEPAR